MSYSGNLYNVAVEGKEKEPSGAYIQLKIRMKECIDVFIATVSAASAPTANTTTAFANELIVPFWMVRSTGDKDRANMQHSTLWCPTSIVPILQNTRPLKEGEELLIFNGDFTEQTHSIEPQVPTTTQSAKKGTAASAPTAAQPPKKKKRLYAVHHRDDPPACSKGASDRVRRLHQATLLLSMH